MADTPQQQAGDADRLAAMIHAAVDDEGVRRHLAGLDADELAWALEDGAAPDDGAGEPHADAVEWRDRWLAAKVKEKVLRAARQGKG